MDLQELLPGRIDSLIPLHSDEDWSLRPSEATVTDNLTEQELSHIPSVNSLALQRLEQLLLADSDDRLDCMREASLELTAEQLLQVDSITQNWLDDEARERMRAMVRECHEKGKGPRDALLSWYTNEEFQRLVDSLQEAQISDLHFAVCYALCEAHDTAYAAYLIHISRTQL